MSGRRTVMTESVGPSSASGEFANLEQVLQEIRNAIEVLAVVQMMQGSSADHGTALGRVQQIAVDLKRAQRARSAF
jgi:hypothetical protein